MKTPIALCVISTLLTLPFAALPAKADEKITTINVELLDMSSTAGPGLMIRHKGQGMMMKGMGTGAGMMAGMGKMSIEASLSTVKAGKIHFAVVNQSFNLPHEMLVVQVDDPEAALPYDVSIARIPEDKINSPGEVESLGPKKSGAIDLELDPGSYFLICNIAGHYAAGMVTLLTVTQ
jgi:uncharacterized cupredoxin-like copper-binding protein